MAAQHKKALAFFAHPDDAEFLCAGTLTLLSHNGWQTDIATMTAGDGGSAELSPEAIAQLRLAEAARSAALLGGIHHCLFERDLTIAYDAPTLRKVTEVIRQVKPDVVFTHSPTDYLVDHEMTSLLVRAACFNASVPNFKTETEQPAPATAAVPFLYYADALEGRDIYGQPVPPGFYIDISATIQSKEQMLACHASQREWLRKQHGMDQYLNAMKEWSAHRGAEAGVSYAEAFRQHLGHAYPPDNLLADFPGVIPGDCKT